MKMYVLKKIPEYDLASAPVPDDIGHPFKRPYQVPGDGNTACTIYLADR